MSKWGSLLTRYRVPLVLFAACVAAYALFAPSLGFYWDGWPFVWISETYGSEGLTRYFSTNRPFWGWLYQLTTPLIGSSIILWQLFGVITRWFSGIAFWALLKRLWPKQPEAVNWAALLFVLYPGFSQSPIANMYGHFYVVLALALVSLWLHIGIAQGSVEMEKGHRSDFVHRKTLPSIAALGMATYALFANEYFFGLELLRPVLLFLVLPGGTIDRRFKQVCRLWWPYAVMILLYAYWRIFILGFHTYDLGIATEAAPSQTIFSLGLKVISEILLSGIVAWGVPIARLLQSDWASRFTLLAAAILPLAAIWFFFALRDRPDGQANFARSAIALGFITLVVSGLPVWAIGLPMRFAFPNDRLTLPMMAGASILLVGLVALLRWPTVRRGLLAILAGCALAFQLLVGVDYRDDWRYQLSFFWQLTWRAPRVQPGTTFVLHELEVMHLTDNSLVAPLNWLYAPGNKDDELDYYAADILLRTRPGSFLYPLEAGRPINTNNLVADFHGLTDRMLTILFRPPGCLRVLDPVYDFGYPQLPDGLKEAVPLSNPAGLIIAGATIEPAAIFGSEPSHESWCYFFQLADLARQQGNWARVAELGDEAFALEDNPNHATELLPFIEGYAMTGRWTLAEKLTRQTLDTNRFTETMLCSLWQRVQANAPSPDMNTAEAMLALVCN